MANFNKVFLMGNLTRDPELRYTASGASVTSFGLAINSKYKHGEEMKEETCFVDITAWGRLGETCSEYLSKGKPVFIEGRLNYRSWETAEGQKRSKLEVVASNVQFLGRAGDNRTSNRMEENPPPPTSGEESPMDDIPF
ncbi:MAG: single-stranded DNA-binding protein [Nitrospinae bacterium]|nr:single-stranded DNA-binding protein [Nitrospinota bacterium]